MIRIDDPGRGRIGILTTDTELVVRTWDDELARMTGISRERVIGRRLDEVVPGLRERSLFDLLREPIVSGLPVVLASALHKYLIPCPPCEPSQEFDRMQQRVMVGGLRDDAGTAGIVITVEDVTARMERERRLARQLRDADPAARLAAVKGLAIDEPSDVEQLTGAIADEDWKVRRAAVKALSLARDAALVEALVTALRVGHRNFSLLSSALQLLACAGVDLTAALIGLLHDRDADLRIQAALALGTQNTPDAVAALLDALDDSDANVKFHAIEALGKLASVAAIDRLADIAESRDFFLAFPAIEALVRINDPIVAPRLTPLLQDPILGGIAADALGRLGDESVIGELTAALENPSNPVEPLTSAIAAIHRRHERASGGAPEIEDVVTRSLSQEAARRILDAIAHATGPALRDLVVVVGWVKDPAVPASLARLLGSHGVRHDVIEALVRHGARAVDLLIEQFKNDDVETRRAAATALGRIGDRRAVPALIAVLRDDSREVWVSAIGALAGIGDARAFLPLLELLGDADPGIRQAATGALNSIGHPDMEGHVRALLDAPDARTRESAVKIAGYFGYPTCADAFVARCGDAEESVRCAALEYLPYFDEPRTFDVLAAAMRGGTPRARAAATKALGVVPGRQAEELLQAALDDDEPWVRYFAAISLGRRGDPTAVARLVQCAAGDRAHQVRIAAVEALGSIGGEEAVDALAPLATDGDKEVGHAAVRVLGRLRGSGTGHVLVAALRSSDPRRRLAAAESLTSRGDEAAVDSLRWTAAADADPAVAAAARAGLATIANAGLPASRAAADALVRLAANPEHHDWAGAELATLAPATIPWLADALSSEAPRARIAVVEALARMLHPAATACIQRALDDADAAVRRQAVLSLSRIGARGLADRLSSLAERDSSPLVRQAAAAAPGRDSRRRYERDGMHE